MRVEKLDTGGNVFLTAIYFGSMVAVCSDECVTMWKSLDDFWKNLSGENNSPIDTFWCACGSERIKTHDRQRLETFLENQLAASGEKRELDELLVTYSSNIAVMSDEELIKCVSVFINHPTYLQGLQLRISFRSIQSSKTTLKNV